MFKPHGFRPLSGLRRHFDAARMQSELGDKLRWDEASLIVRREMRLDGIRKTGPQIVGKFEPLPSAVREVDEFDMKQVLVERSIRAFWRYAVSCPLYLCGPATEPLRVSNRILDRFGPGFVEGSKWKFLSEDYLAVHVGSLLREIQAAKVVAASPRFRLSRVERKMFGEIIESEGAASSLAPLEGHLLCTLEGHVPDDDAVLAAFGYEKTDTPEGQVASGQGRPRKVEDAADAYERQFPNGHAGYRNEEVLRRLEKEEGISVGVDTLRAAVRLVERRKNVDKVAD